MKKIGRIRKITITEDTKLLKLPRRLKSIRHYNEVSLRSITALNPTHVAQIERMPRFDPRMSTAIRYFKSIGLKEVTFKLD